MKTIRAAGALGAFACLHTGLALAQNPSPTDIRACAGIETDAQRLLCYDKAVGRPNLVTAQKKGDPEASREQPHRPEVIRERNTSQHHRDHGKRPTQTARQIGQRAERSEQPGHSDSAP